MASDTPIPPLERGLFSWIRRNPTAVDTVVSQLNKLCALEIAFGGKRFAVRFAGENALIDLKETIVSSTSALPSIAAYTVLANPTSAAAAPVASATPILSGVQFGAAGATITGSLGDITITPGDAKSVTVTTTSTSINPAWVIQRKPDKSFLRFKDADEPRYRSDWSLASAGGGLDVNSYSDITSEYLPMAFGARTFRIETGTGSRTEALRVTSARNLLVGTTSETGLTSAGVAVAGDSIFSTQITVPKLVFTGAVIEVAGSGTPEGSVSAAIGSTYRRTDGSSGTTLYIKESGSGNTGWVGASSGGSGTVTHTAGALTANAVVLGAGTGDTKVVAGLFTDGTSKLTLGAAGVSVGGLLLANATSGSVELRPVTGALGTVVISVPAATDTMALLAATQTFTNKTLTTPKIGTGIYDTSGNELFLLTATAAAVNELTFANAATAGNPGFSASGGDTNIGINLTTKGTGDITIFCAPGSTSPHGLTLENSNGAPLLRFNRSTAQKAAIGVASGSSSLIVGDAADELDILTIGSNAINFSTDGGASIAGKFVASTGQFSLLKNIASSSTTTGTLVVTGGLGVSGAMFSASLNTSTLTVSGTATTSITNTTSGHTEFFNLLAPNAGDGNQSYWYLGVAKATGKSFIFDFYNGTAGASYTDSFLAFAVFGENPVNSFKFAQNGVATFGGNFTTGGSLTTAAPAGASAHPWKLGSLVTGLTLTASLTQAVYVDINGTVYKLLTAT